MSKLVSKTRFYIYTVAFIPFVLTLITGVILLKYHTGALLESTVMGFDGHFWFSFHKIMSLIVIPLVLLHLFVKTDWIKRFFTFKLKGAFKVSNIILVFIFLLCTLTALGSWLVSNAIGGVHNKLGLLLIIIFLIHVWNYRKVIINHFKKFN